MENYEITISKAEYDDLLVRAYQLKILKTYLFSEKVCKLSTYSNGLNFDIDKTAIQGILPEDYAYAEQKLQECECIKDEDD